jgi:hypothetical protein
MGLRVQAVRFEQIHQRPRKMAYPADAQGRNEQRTPDLQLTNGMFLYADTDLCEFVSTLEPKFVEYLG